jgi:hypothetical protein
MTDPGWMGQARCRNLPAKLARLFHSTDPLEQQYARHICAACPVRQPCHDYAAGHWAWGVWGGATFRDGHPGSAR